MSIRALSTFLRNPFSGMLRSRRGADFPLPKSELTAVPPVPELTGEPIGLIAGNGSFPRMFILAAHKAGRPVVAVCHRGETEEDVARRVSRAEWIRVGELGRMIDIFKSAGVRQVAMAGGINRVRLFGGTKLDARGAALILRLRSTKDDLIMRGIAEELLKEGITVVESTIFLEQALVPFGVLTTSAPTDAELNDIEVGREAIRVMGSQDIGQLVVVREGVIVAVEAVEGSDAAIRRGGQLGKKGAVVVKYAKPTQDMRFDVPTVGVRTIRSMIEARCRVLAVESGRCLMLDAEDVIALANRSGIAIVGCKSLV